MKIENRLDKLFDISRDIDFETIKMLPLLFLKSMMDKDIIKYDWSEFTEKKDLSLVLEVINDDKILGILEKTGLKQNLKELSFVFAELKDISFDTTDFYKNYTSYKAKIFEGNKKFNFLNSVISKGMVELLNPTKKGKVVNLFNSLSSLNTDMLDFSNDFNFIIQDNNSFNSGLNDIDFILNDFYNFKTFNENLIERYSKSIGKERNSCDYAIGFPAANERISLSELELLKKSKFSDCIKGRVKNYFNIDVSLDMLNDNGKGVFLFYGKSFYADKLSKKYIDEDIIEGIIQLPVGLIPSTYISLTIVIFNKNKKVKNKIFMIDSSNEYNKENKVIWSSEETIKAYIERKEYVDFSRYVSTEEIIENDYSLNMSKYISEDLVNKEYDIKKFFESIIINKTNYLENESYVENTLPSESDLIEVKLNNRKTKIPSSWKIKTMNELFYLRVGERISKDDLSISGYPVFSATESDDCFGYVEDVKKIVRKDIDLIIPARGTSLGFAKLFSFDSTGTQATIIAASKSENKIESKYVQEYLKYQRNNLFNDKVSVIKQIRTLDLGMIQIPIPDEETQKLIINSLKINENKITSLEKLLDFEREHLLYKKQSLFSGFLNESKLKLSEV